MSIFKQLISITCLTLFSYQACATNGLKVEEDEGGYVVTFSNLPEDFNITGQSNVRNKKDGQLYFQGRVELQVENKRYPEESKEYFSYCGWHGGKEKHGDKKKVEKFICLYY